MAPTKTEIIDLFWRSVWTFLEVFLGILSVDYIASIFDAGGGVELGRLPLYAAGGAVAAVVKTYASNKLGTGTATDKAAPTVGLAPVASEVAKPAQ